MKGRRDGADGVRTEDRIIKRGTNKQGVTSRNVQTHMSYCLNYT